MIKVIREVLGNPKKKENVLDPTDRLWLLNHTNYKVSQKSKSKFVKFETEIFNSHLGHPQQSEKTKEKMKPEIGNKEKCSEKGQKTDRKVS